MTASTTAQVHGATRCPDCTDGLGQPRPVELGLWVWSTEFQWAARFFAVFKRKAQDAWRHAKQHPVSSAAITLGGLAAAGAAFWAVGHFQLVDQAKLALGL